MSKTKRIDNEDIEIKKGDLGSVYIRLSSKDEMNEKKNESIQNQIALAKAWFKDNGCKIYEIYIDEFVSGAKDEISFEGLVINRPQFKRLMEDSRQNKFRFVWIKDFDRFSRDVAVQETAIRTLNSINVKVFSYFNQGDSTMIRQIKGTINEEYVRELRRKVKTYHENSLKKNIPLCRPILGYRVQRKQGVSTGKWIIDKRESKKVIDIFEDFVFKKLSFKELEDKYNITKIRRVLTNKKYLGTFVFYDEEKRLGIPLFLPSTLFTMAEQRIKQLDSHSFNHTKFKKHIS